MDYLCLAPSVADQVRLSWTESAASSSIPTTESAQPTLWPTSSKQVPRYAFSGRWSWKQTDLECFAR